MEHALDFTRVNILIGPNNCGKSNFLEALSFPSGVVENGLYETLQEHGMSAIPNRCNSEPNVLFDYVFEEPDAPVPHRYRLDVHIDRKKTDSYFLKEERLSNEESRPGHDEPFHFFKCHLGEAGYGFCSFHDREEGHASRKISVREKETFFKQVDDVLEALDSDERNRFIDNVNPYIKKIRRYFQGWKSYSMSKISVQDLVFPAKVTDSDEMLTHSGNNFQNLLRIMFNDDSIDRFEEIIKIKKIIPALKKIKPVVTDMCSIELRIQNETFRLSEMSDGTLRMLLLTLLTRSSLRPNTLMLDEPEINIHPAWQKIVYDLMSDDSDSMQLFISTHSPDLLDRFTTDFMQGAVKVFVFDQGKITDLASKMAYLKPRMEEEGWELGDLYRVGDPGVGGWPW